MPDNHPGTSNYTVRLIKHKSAQMFARGALAVTLSAAMGTAMIPTQAIAEGLDAATTATEQKAAATDQAPTFDPKSVVYNAGEVSMTLDGKSEGTFSVFQVATSWVAGTPKQSADGAWTCTLTITPKDENKIAGHFGDSGYELDSANSKLTLTYTYNKWSGWHAFDKADHATVAYKKAEQAPTFDASQAANDSNAVKLLLDGVEQGGFSVSQVADSWTAGTPKKDADGNWTCTLTFVPKAENKIAGHFGDSGYELDEANSKLTVTYTYSDNKWNPGGKSLDKADHGTLAFKKAEQAPAFDVTKQDVDVVVYDAGEFDPAYETTKPLSADVATVGEVYKKDDKWAVDVTLKQGTAKDYGVADHTTKGVYLFDDANSVTEITYVTSSLKTADWKPEGDAAKVAFAQVEAPTADDIVNAQVTVKTTDGSKEKNYYLGAGTYEVGPVTMGYANPMCVVTLKADKQQSYVDEFNAEKDADGTYELAAKPNDIQFYFSYDPDTQEWTNTTTDQYIYVKEADQIPTFDADDAANEAGDVKLLLDGEDQGNFSVAQVAKSWTATEPKQDADGNWTVDLTFVPKDENKIAGHFGDSGYELDEANSKLTVTYEYNKNSGWHAFDKADRGTLAFKKAAVTPDKPSKPTQPTTPTNPTNPNNNGGKATGNNANNNAGNNAKVTPKAGATKANAAKAAATKAAASKASVPKTGDNNSLAGMATAGVLGAVSLLIAAVEKLHDLREQLR
jgi:hypothetical protein